MNIIDIMKARHGNQTLFAAKEADENEANRLVDCYQKLWDNGNSFAGGILSFGAKRSADTADEANACADELHKHLQGVVRQSWINSLTRDEAVATCNVLIRFYSTNQICLTVSGYAIDPLILRENGAILIPTRNAFTARISTSNESSFAIRTFRRRYPHIF